MIIRIILDILIILLILCCRKQSTSSKRQSPSQSRHSQSAEPLDTESEQDDVDSANNVSFNKHGLPTTKAGRISIKHMEIFQQISSTKRCPGALPLLGYHLIFGHAYSLFTLVKCRPFVLFEMNRDDGVRKQIFVSACRYALGPDQIV